jgi:hypothetical protein
MKKLLTLTLAIMMITLVLAGAAMAATVGTGSATAATVAGALSISFVTGHENIVFNSVNLNNLLATGSYDYYSTSAPQFTLTDATGSDNGWHVNFSITNLSHTTITGQNVLDVKFAQDQTSTLPADTTIGSTSDTPDATNGPVKVQVNELPNINNPERVAKAEAGYGKGTYTLVTNTGDFGASGNYKITLTPATVLAGTYKGTFVATILGGPGGQGTWQGTIE